DALRAHLALVERELHPRLDADDLVALDEQLHAALLPAEAAVRLDGPVRHDAGVEPQLGRHRSVRAEALDDLQWWLRDLGHGCVRSVRGAARRGGLDSLWLSHGWKFA